MSHDYSRIRHDPSKHHLGVLLQQGRPLTDADWNELVSQLLRRDQAASLDTFGPAVVPAITPDAFLVQPVAGGFTLGAGRIYVDGLLVENHGTGALTWESRLEQQVGSSPTPYASQPYLPSPPAMPALPYAVVLDVWQREVGPWHDEDLLEKALGGVDTTARWQTVWQVTAQPVAAGSTCSSAFTPPAPSAARLSSAAASVPGTANPCLVPPGGGYQGGENQLYRIEVHDGGPQGTATFKWSRDNASLHARVLNIPDLTHLVVDSVGRDEVQRFNDGDWIEVLDDRLELAGQASANGSPGLLRRIVIGAGVDDTTRTITLAQALPAGQFPVNAQGEPTGDFHVRIRRWDQRGLVRRADGTVFQDLDALGSTGAITIPPPGTQLLLESGVLVSFSLAVAGGRFRSGDWWAVAARASDASVEILTDAPPRGIHHHSTRLAIVTATGVLDCRVPWPPDAGCCTVVVEPGESIQDAIDSLPPQGGCVCLKNGVHNIADTIVIGRSNVKLHGEAPGAVVRGNGLPQLLAIGLWLGAIEDVEVQQITFEGTAVPPFGYLAVAMGVERLRLAHCTWRHTGGLPTDCSGLGLVLVSDVEFTGNRIEGCVTGLFVQSSLGSLRVQGNDFIGLVDTQALLPLPIALYGIRVNQSSALWIGDNRIADFAVAVSLQVDAANAIVSGNQITRVPMPAALDLPQPQQDMQWAIEALADGARIEGNRIEVPSVVHGGIHVAGQRVVVRGNVLTGGAPVSEIAGPLGVLVGPFVPGPVREGAGSNIADNQFSALVAAVVAQHTREVAIAGNVVRNEERYGFGIFVARCQGMQIRGNGLQDVGIPLWLMEGQGNQVHGQVIDRCGLAALLSEEGEVDFSDNRIDDARDQGVLAFLIHGTHRYAGNRLRHCGWQASDMAVSIGVLDLAAAGCLIVTDNEILATGVNPAAGFGAAPAVGIGAGALFDVVVADNRVAYRPETPKLDPTLEHRALSLVGPPALTAQFGAGTIVFVQGGAQVHGNHFAGPGFTHLVELLDITLASPGPGSSIVTRFGRVTFANNRCDHDTTDNDQHATVSLRGGHHLIVQGNHQRAPQQVFAMDLGNRPNAVVIGNVSTGLFRGVSTTVPAPINSFNVRV